MYRALGAHAEVPSGYRQVKYWRKKEIYTVGDLGVWKSLSNSRWIRYELSIYYWW